MELLWLTPVLVVVITLAQRRLGDHMGGRLAALPVTSTAVIAIAALDQGAAVAQSVVTGIVSGAPVAVACLTTVRWLAGHAAKGTLATTRTVAKVPLAATGVARGTFRTWDLAVRVGVTTGCVAGLTAATHLYPPQVAGVLGAFPAL